MTSDETGGSTPHAPPQPSPQEGRGRQNNSWESGKKRRLPESVGIRLHSTAIRRFKDAVASFGDSASSFAQIASASSRPPWASAR